MSVTATRTQLPTGTWSVDPVRSRVGFEVKQFGVAAVRGAFNEFEGTLELGDDLADARVRGSVAVASLDTKQRRRDAHLCSPDFLDADRYPELTFASTGIRPLDARTFEIAGELTMHGTTRPIALAAEVRDDGDDWPEPHVALTVRGRIDRGDFGVAPGPLLDAVVADRVELQLEISALKAA